MQITQPNLNAIFNAFDLRFQLAYQAAKPWYAQVATEVPSKTTQQTYAWMAKIPRLREWVGERVAQNVATYGYTIVNKDYELTKLEKALPLLLPASEIDVRVLTYRSSEILFIEVKEGADKPYYVKNGQKTQAYVRADAVNLPANKRVLKKFIGGQSAAGTAGGFKKDEKIIFNLFEQNGQLKVSQIRDILNYSERRIKKILESLSRKGLLVPSHNEKNVYYKTKDSSLTGR